MMGIVLVYMETILVSILVCGGFYWWDVKKPQVVRITLYFQLYFLFTFLIKKVLQNVSY